jgi:hypothetical protein
MVNAKIITKIDRAELVLKPILLAVVFTTAKVILFTIPITIPNILTRTAWPPNHSK